MSERRFLSVEEAIHVLPDGDEIHTLTQIGCVFIGSDWNREDIIDKIKKNEIREIAGPLARREGHGLVLYTKNAKYLSDVLFVETDMKKLDEIDTPEEAKP